MSEYLSNPRSYDKGTELDWLWTQSLMVARRHRNVAQISTPALFTCPGNRYSRPFCRPEDWDYPDGADNWVQAEGADVDR